MKKMDKFSYFVITALLSLKGFIFKEEINFKFEIWHNPNSKKCFRIKRSSGLLSKEEVLDILYQAEISLKEFSELV